MDLAKKLVCVALLFAVVSEANGKTTTKKPKTTTEESRTTILELEDCSKYTSDCQQCLNVSSCKFVTYYNCGDEKNESACVSSMNETTLKNGCTNVTTNTTECEAEPVKPVVTAVPTEKTPEQSLETTPPALQSTATSSDSSTSTPLTSTSEETRVGVASTDSSSPTATPEGSSSASTDSSPSASATSKSEESTNASTNSTPSATSILTSTSKSDVSTGSSTLVTPTPTTASTSKSEQPTKPVLLGENSAPTVTVKKRIARLASGEATWFLSVVQYREQIYTNCIFKNMELAKILVCLALLCATVSAAEDKPPAKETPTTATETTTPPKPAEQEECEKYKDNCEQCLNTTSCKFVTYYNCDDKNNVSACVQSSNEINLKPGCTSVTTNDKCTGEPATVVTSEKSTEVTPPTTLPSSESTVSPNASPSVTSDVPSTTLPTGQPTDSSTTTTEHTIPEKTSTTHAIDVTTTDKSKTDDDTPHIEGNNRHFDAASFVGGIVLAIGLLAIAFVGFKFYRARTEHNYHTLHETVHM